MQTGRRDFLTVSASYWAFTLTDGALRMLVLLHFYQTGFNAFQLALLFTLYELAGIFTNLAGGWLAGRFGLRAMLGSGIGLQIGALVMLAGLDSSWPGWLALVWVLLSQGLSGIAKDMTKVAAKSAIRLSAGQAGSRLFTWTAFFTGSKNSVKGAGFFLGGLLLGWIGFEATLLGLAGFLLVLLGLVWMRLPGDLGLVQSKRKGSGLLARSRQMNLLSAARVFLFGARDIWFVVGLPVTLYGAGWSFWQTGGFLALWTVFYGMVQASAPRFVARSPDGLSAELPAAGRLAGLNFLVIAGLWAALIASPAAGGSAGPIAVLIGGLLVFGAVFALNSSVHSYLLLALTGGEKTSEDVGFYYAANAAGRLAGTLLSGWCMLQGGIAACLLGAGVFLLLAFILTRAIQPPPQPV